MRLNLFFRKAYPTAFSIERLFDQLSEAFVQRGVSVHRLELPEYNNTLGNVRSNNRWARTQVQGCSRKEPCIHHVTGDVNSIVFALRGPSVITIHDCNPLLRYPRWHPRYWFYRWMIFEGPARRAAAVTVISEKTRRELVELTSVKEEKLHVIPNFVDPAFVPRDRPFNTARPTILQIGVKPNKNLARLAEALAGVPCRLEIIGQPSDDDLAALEAHNIEFNWATGLSDAEVRQRYTECDLLAFVSTYEGFGLPILEAQVTGRPVVTSNLSPHREVAGPGGAALVDPFEPAAIREGILQVIRHPEYRNQLIERGRENVVDYHIDSVANRYLDLYSSLL
ncbi:glycosyltransferase family 4 protein [Neolewinella litorea]|uniref:Glycosyltransferase family 1 protein n=1 Tax=Neolewinella litorea TaxID=2562452 RepID=A0A4S4NHV4_9BACT|nr:glycosyltransferase family 1 protein [Neolewinella litorea]THH39282.1 glycosyltransferase family 1 protein [Neolewinella litorea]